MITRQLLLSLLHYDYNTGTFAWVKGRGGNAPLGGVAGSMLANGYVSIAINGKRYLAHRLAWFYVHGRWPVAEVDHKNRCRSDNRISNLREATASQNRANSGLRRDCTSGIKGVSFHSAVKRWRATIQRDGKQYHLGYFDTAEQAAVAYRAAAASLFGEFAAAA